MYLSEADSNTLVVPVPASTVRGPGWSRCGAESGPAPGRGCGCGCNVRNDGFGGVLLLGLAVLLGLVCGGRR